MLFSSKNTKLKINDIEVLARDCSLSLSSSTAARFDSKDRRSNSFVADKGVSSSLSLCCRLQHQSDVRVLSDAV